MLNASLLPPVRTIGPRVDAIIAGLLERIGGAVERAVGRVARAGEVDLIADFAHRLPIDVIAELFDVPEEDRSRLAERSRVIARGMDRFYGGDDVNAGLRELGAYFLQMVSERTGTHGDDVVRRLARAEHHGDRLSQLEVVAMCTALVFGGHETTVNLIGNGMLALLRRPDELERLRAEPGLVPTAVEELLRFDSPAQFISRVAAGDFVLDGKRLAGGDTVLLGIGAANRDPGVFADQDRLDVGRSPNPHLAFGVGTHTCPGAQLSRIEARAAIPALLARFPRLRLGRTPPVRRPTAILRGLESLPVVVE
jgi:hypothetical protein